MQQDTRDTRVGFIGLGLMGYPMARNLAEAGYHLTVSNRSPGKAECLTRETGCEAAKNVEDLAKNSDFVITMLPGPQEVEEVIGGDAGVIANAPPGATIIDMSTSSPPLARTLAKQGRERGVHLLDAPVSGGDVGAIAGTLTIMVGGEESVFEHAGPLSSVMGRTVIYVGEAGAGQVVKAANQTVVALTIQAVSEALVLARHAGVDAEKVLDVLGGGLAANNVMKVKREKFLSGEFEPGGKVASQHKDLGIVLETARQAGVVMPATALCDQLYASLLARGMGGLDHSALIKAVENLSGD